MTYQWLICSTPLFAQIKTWSFGGGWSNLLMAPNCLVKAPPFQAAAFQALHNSWRWSVNSFSEMRWNGSNTLWVKDLCFTVWQLSLPVFGEIMSLMSTPCSRDLKGLHRTFPRGEEKRKPLDFGSLALVQSIKAVPCQPFFTSLNISFCVNLHLKIKFPLLKLWL